MVKKSYRVEITATAERDIRDIWDYIAENNPGNAVLFIGQIETKALSLDLFPERHPLVPEDEYLQGKYRHLIYKEYRIIYRILDDVVYIMRVIHSSRLLDIGRV